MQLPEILAAIDIGTNSVHMIVARMSATERFEVVTRHKEVVRLGSGGSSTLDTLSEDAIDRGIAALGRCRAILDTYDAPYLAVATSAVREASNGQLFIDRAQSEAGIDVDVISGYEEARLIHLGVLQALPIFDQKMLMCDIGGGSTELLVGLRGDIEAVRSFKLGAIRLTERFFPGGDATSSALKAARHFVQDLIAPFSKGLRKSGIDVMVGSSGTIETIFNVANARAGISPRALNGATLTRAQVTEVVELLASAESSAQRASIDGMDPARADIIVGGAVILERIMKQAKVAEITFSDNALREGALFDLSSRIRGRSVHSLSELRRSSVEHLMELCDDDPEHSIHVATLALQLFEGLQAELELPDSSAGLLQSAAMLANVGLFVSHSKHHKHSYYVIRNSEHLMGFTDHEIELIAQVARYHRRGAPSVKHEPFRSLDEKDKALVTSLAAILRIAIGLDRSHSQSVKAVSVELSEASKKQPKRLSVQVDPVDGADVAMELFAVGERAALLENVTGRCVETHTPARDERRSTAS